MSGLIFIGIGIIGLIVVILLKQKINNFYDNVKGLSESHAKFYKNVVVILIPIIFILMGLYFFITQKVNDDFKRNIIEKLNLNTISVEFIFGCIILIFGLITLALRLTKQKYRIFSKLSVMEEKYGKITGNIIHILGYTVVPIILGVILIYSKIGI